MLMSLSAVHAHCYILVTSKSLSMKKSCICMSISYVHIIMYRYVSIRGGYLNKVLNRVVPLVTHLLIPILMVSDLQTDDVALKSKNAWLVLFVPPYHVYP